MCEYLGVFMIGCWLIEGWWLLVARVPVLVTWRFQLLALSCVRSNGPTGEAALAARAAGVQVEVVPVWNKHMLSTGHVGILLAALVHVAVHIIWDTPAKPRNGSNSILLSRS